MKALFIIFLSSLVWIGMYLWFPLSTFDSTSLQNLGAAVTTIAGTDTLSASRTTINNNFSNINTELLTVVGTTTNSTITSLTGLTTASALVTVGTITSGTWNATNIAINKGGTATTTFINGGILFYDSTLGTVSQANTQTAFFFDKANARLGISTSTSPYYRLTIGSGAIHVAENTPATSTSITIDARDGNQQRIGIANAATTITITNMVEGQKLSLVVCNPASGTAGTITWASTPTGRIRWPSGAVPTQTTTAGNCDVWAFLATQATTSGMMIFGSQAASF